MKEDGYTLVEVLVALVLLSILLLFTTNIFSSVTNNALYNSKKEAIEIAKRKMAMTISLKDYTPVKKEITEKFILIRTVEKSGENVVVKIEILDKVSNRLLYHLNVIRPVEVENEK